MKTSMVIIKTFEVETENTTFRLKRQDALFCQKVKNWCFSIYHSQFNIKLSLEIVDIFKYHSSSLR